MIACGVYIEWVDGKEKNYMCEDAEIKDNMLIIRYSENLFNYVPITQSIRDIKIKKLK